MKPLRSVTAVLAVLMLLLTPPLAISAERIPDSTPANGRPGGVDIIGAWDGTSWRVLRTDSDGVLSVTEANSPSFEVINHKTNVTVAAAGVDSSATPVITAGYKRVWALVRIREATVAAAASLEFGVRGHLTAQLDSTAGWWFKLGAGASKSGKTLAVADFGRDRFVQIPLVDSLSGQFVEAPYMSLWIVNRTGAQIKTDTWLLGAR